MPAVRMTIVAFDTGWITRRLVTRLTVGAVAAGLTGRAHATVSIDREVVVTEVNPFLRSPQ